MIDDWVRNNKDLKFDKDGNYASVGKVDDLILNQAIDNFEFKSYETSLDVKDFDTSFVKGLSFEDGCATLKNDTSKKQSFIEASVDLINVENDKVKIIINPPKITQEEIIFYIPQIVPGTYEYSNFGRFIENVKALDDKGKSLKVEAIDENSWKIFDAKKLDRVTYYANDTFDGPEGKDIYPMGCLLYTSPSPRDS